MRKYLTVMAGFAAVALVAMGASGCDENTSAKSDETVCVFDGSERGSQKLKYQILPGQEPRHADGNDEIVRIPTSFRFYAAFRDRSIADAGSPKFYLGYARSNTPVEVEGQFKFRFNVDNACEWYARHGRRNAQAGNLGFNARSNEAASSLSPWVRWLNENFGTVGKATIKSSTLGFTWPELVYGNDPEAKIDRDGPIDIVYGRRIGRVFTERLNNSLGGKFFCGTDPTIWANDGGIDDLCPPIFFETGPILTQNRRLMSERAKTEALRAELENAAVQAEIRRTKVDTQRKDERTKQQILREQVETARLQALANQEIQECLVLAKQGLDCDGKHPPVIVGGSRTG